MRRGLLTVTVLAAPLILLQAVGPAASAGPTADGNRSALIIGVSAHPGNRPKGTVGGAGDAAAMADVFRRAGWAESELRVLVDGAATAGAIRAGIDWLRDRSSAGSFSVFHYSGHVYQRPNDPDGDGEALDEFLVPYDTRNIIADRELGNRLNAIQGWLWTNISGCEAAGFNEGGLAGPKRLFTGSSHEHEKSYERPDWRMSVYTGLFAREAVLNRHGDTNRDGTVTIQEAFRYAEGGAPPMTRTQRKGVQTPFLAGGDGTEWHFKPPAPPPPPPAPSNAPSAPAPQKLCLLPGICLP